MYLCLCVCVYVLCPCVHVFGGLGVSLCVLTGVGRHEFRKFRIRQKPQTSNLKTNPNQTAELEKEAGTSKQTDSKGILTIV